MILLPYSEQPPSNPGEAADEYPVLEPLLLSIERDPRWAFTGRRNAAGFWSIQGVRLVVGSHMDVLRFYPDGRVVLARVPLVGAWAGTPTLQAEGPPEKVLPLLDRLPEREA
jgi:hypothetical protein